MKYIILTLVFVSVAIAGWLTGYALEQNVSNLMNEVQVSDELRR